MIVTEKALLTVVWDMLNNSISHNSISHSSYPYQALVNQSLPLESMLTNELEDCDAGF